MKNIFSLISLFTIPLQLSTIFYASEATEEITNVYFRPSKNLSHRVTKTERNDGFAITPIYAHTFGFLPSSSATKNTAALQQISTFINQQKGGVELIIDKGNYTVGHESLSGKIGKGYSFLGDTMLQISGCSKPVVINGSGATIRFVNGLHFGSFDPQSGKTFTPPSTGAFYDYNYVSYPQSILSFTANESIRVKNLTIDGNIQNFIIGGRWGDEGIQLPADAIFGKDNKELILENVTGKYMPRDGLQIGNTIPTEASPVKKVFLYNCTFDGNVRQAFSWVGGNHLYAENCRFQNTGKTVNSFTKKRVRSSPAAGIDMEAELGLIRNAQFNNCTIDNNDGAGLLSVGNVANVRWHGGKIIGATNWSIYGSGSRYVFDSTVIVGSPVNIGNGKSKFGAGATKFISCLVSADSTLSPTGKVYGNYVMDFGGGALAQFYRCTIDYANHGSVYGGDLLFDNCTFKWDIPIAPNLNGYSFLTGTFTGITRFFSSAYPSTSAPPNPNRTNSKFFGPFFINGKDFTNEKNINNSLPQAFLSNDGYITANNQKKATYVSDTVLITKATQRSFTEANLITANATPAVIEHINVAVNTSLLVDAIYTVGKEGGKQFRFEKTYLLKNTADKLTVEKETNLQGTSAKEFGGEILRPIQRSGSFMLSVKGTTTPLFWTVKWRIDKTSPLN